jgi:hypothetical protein
MTSKTNVGMIYRWVHVSISNIKFGLEEFAHGYQNFNIDIWWYVKMREYLYTLFITWVNNIVNYVNTTIFNLGAKVILHKLINMLKWWSHMLHDII